MTTDFERDLETALAEMNAARDSLIARVRGLSDADLERGRRGQWTIAQVLQHVLQSDGYYVNLIADLRGQPRPQPLTTAVGSVQDAVENLMTSAHRILSSVEGVDEETFYRMGGPAHQQYSVLSALENVALHDHEHSAQMEQILAHVIGSA